MGLQGCLNTYMLILLLSAIAAINAQAARTKNDTSIGIGDGDKYNSTNISIYDSENDTSINTDDGNNKNNTSFTGNNDSKNDTCISMNNNDNITGDDVKDNIRNITSCIMHTKVIGTLITQVIQLTQLVFIFIPGLRNVFLNYFNNLSEYVIYLLVELSEAFQVIVKLSVPFIQFISIFI